MLEKRSKSIYAKYINILSAFFFKDYKIGRIDSVIKNDPTFYRRPCRLRVYKEQKDKMPVSPPAAQTRINVFLRDEQQSSTETRNNERSSCVKDQPLHSRVISQVFPDLL